MQCHKCQYYMKGDSACLKCDFSGEMSHAGHSFFSLDAVGNGDRQTLAESEAALARQTAYMETMEEEESEPEFADYAMRVAEAFREFADMPPTAAACALRRIFRRMHDAAIGRELGISRQAVNSAIRVAKERSAYVRVALRRTKNEKGTDTKA